jgi:hypothetical protein
MSIWCALFGHRPVPGEIYNSGYYFSGCARCREALVRAARDDWRTAPRGHRIVWKAGRHCHSIEADYVLPVPVPPVTLPALPGPFASWRRDLVRLTPRAALRVAATRAEEAGEFRCPRLLLMAVMLGAGLKMLLTFGAAR